MSLLTAEDPEGIERQLLELLFNQHARQFSPKIQEAIDKLPSLNESTLESLGLLDSECPICYVSFRAVIASEEVALATDNPGFASEDLGVTRLADSCGHAFCRRDISKWIRELHFTCPTCRQPIIREAPSSHPNDPTFGDRDYDELMTLAAEMDFSRIVDDRGQDSVRDNYAAGGERVVPPRSEREVTNNDNSLNDQSELVGMYS